jgi:hypothetical protein
MTWSEVLARIIPWLRAEEDTTPLRDEAVSVRLQQQGMAVAIHEQSDYLVSRGRINGFTQQLTRGFQQRSTGE